MKKTEYLSVSDFAQRAGISKQAVYKQLNNKLKEYSTTVDGRKLINIKALELFESQPVEQQVNQKSTNNSTTELALIDMLKHELEVKEQQLIAKDNQIEQLHKLLDQQQQLQAQSNKRILMLEEQLSAEPEEPKEEEQQSGQQEPTKQPIEQPKKKHSLFSWLIK